MKERLLSRRDAVKALAIGAGVATFAPVAGCSMSTSIPRGLKMGDLVEFGSYPQGVSRDAAPIAWRVLDVVDGAALLVSECALDCWPYNEMYVECTWADCSLRAWLNGEFLDSAFSEKERARVMLTRVVNADNDQYGTKGGPDTRDSVFSLSIDEVAYYFTSNEDRLCYPTEYAKTRGAFFISEKGHCPWWLRSPGRDAESAALVGAAGDVWEGGGNVDDDGLPVRPALWLDLEA